MSAMLVKPSPSLAGGLAYTVLWYSTVLPWSIAQPQAAVARREASLLRLVSRKVVGRQISWTFPVDASSWMPAPLAFSNASQAGHWRSSQICSTGAVDFAAGNGTPKAYSLLAGNTVLGRAAFGSALAVTAGSAADELELEFLAMMETAMMPTTTTSTTAAPTKRMSRSRRLLPTFAADFAAAARLRRSFAELLIAWNSLNCPLLYWPTVCHVLSQTTHSRRQFPSEFAD